MLLELMDTSISIVHSLYIVKHLAAVLRCRYAQIFWYIRAMGIRHYTDGQYSVTGDYAAGKKNIIVKVSLESDKITAVEVTPTATIRISLGLQKKFALAIAAEVVGKSLDDVVLDKLAGSSLTTKGWNDAIDKVKQRASA
jgi:uncharacterized protein with FMN-binding domain